MRTVHRGRALPVLARRGGLGRAQAELGLIREAAGLLTILGERRAPFRYCRFRAKLKRTPPTEIAAGRKAPKCNMPRAGRTTRQSTTKPHVTPVIPWVTETLRVTAFPLGGATILPNSWKDITGSDPDEVVKVPPPVQSFEAGPFHVGRLSIGHQPGRIDAILMPDQTKRPDGLANVGGFDLAMDHVLPAAQKMFRPDMVMQRLAVGAILLHQVESVEEGYKILRETIPFVRELPENARDFFLQLNIPIVIGVTNHPQILVNRLLKWVVARFQIFEGATDSGPMQQTVQLVGGPAMVALRVEVDINTPPDLSIPLSHQNILELIDHLATQARAIVANAGWFP